MNKKIIKRKCIIAIETSCDDSCIAIVKDDKIISNTIISSASIQNKYGGVVPEIAAREHEKNIINAFKYSLKEAKIKLDTIDTIAYTSEPGLRVSLNIGEIFAHTLGLLLNIKPIKINHIYAHIFSFWDLKSKIIFPLISLVASGGTTSIFLVNSPTNIKLLNETSDDAIGECYDKIARELNLGYPGGPIIDKMYDESKATINFFTKKNMLKNDYSFSFSGLKTAVLNYINQQKMKKNKIDKIAIISSFQKIAIEMLISKMWFYIKKHHITALSIGGGVSANELLRKEINKTFHNLQIYLPEKKLSGDNAAMIAIYAQLLSK